MHLKELAEQTGDAIAIHYVSLDDLQDTFLDGNSKKHDTSKLIESIRRYGFKDPIAFDPSLNGGSGGIIEGNGRLESLIEIRNQGLNLPRGLKEGWLVPVLFGVNASSEAEAIAFSVEHNWSVLWGSDLESTQITSIFDDSALKEQLEWLDAENSLPLSIEDNLDELLEKLEEDGTEERLGKFQEDEPPDPDEVESRVKLGDVWQLGKHRLYCGDSTDEAKIKEFLGVVEGNSFAGHQIDLLVTDPPYGVSYADKNKRLNAVIKGNRIQTPIENDHLTTETIAEELWLPVFKVMFAISKPGCPYYVFSPQGGELMMRMMMMLQKAGWLLKHSLIWVKNNHVLGGADYHYKHEPALYGWKPGAGHYFIDSRSETSVWEFDKPLVNDLHPTMKPVKMIAYAIENSSRKGELVFDAFLGSGTTLIAAEQSDRICYGCELSEKYCDVILQRWENLTGQTAVLEQNIHKK